MEIIFELLSLVTASVALILLVRARSTGSIKPAVITLYICIGLNIAEILARRLYLKVKATAESATIETVTVALAATALGYAISSKKRGNKSSSGGLGIAITCMIWAVTLFALELLLGFILRKWGTL